MSEIDRTAWDPFAPRPTVRAAEPVEPVDDDQAGALPPNLDRLSKAELVELATARGVDVDGTRVDILDRLRATR